MLVFSGASCRFIQFSRSIRRLIDAKLFLTTTRSSAGSLGNKSILCQQTHHSVGKKEVYQKACCRCNFFLVVIRTASCPQVAGIAFSIRFQSTHVITEKTFRLLKTVSANQRRKYQTGRHATRSSTLTVLSETEQILCSTRARLGKRRSRSSNLYVATSGSTRYQLRLVYYRLCSGRILREFIPIDLEGNTRSWSGTQ